MQKPAADKRYKNDKRDAAFLARLLACHNIVEIFIPPKEVEAARDLSRVLDDTRDDLQRHRQRLSKFLLRRGYVFDEVTPRGQRESTWTRDHRKWLESLCFTGPARTVFVDYVASAKCAETYKRSLEKAVKAEARTDRWASTVRALCTIKGIDELSAFCLACEAGCFSRFRCAGEYASWCGFIPSEHSSGEKEIKDISPRWKTRPQEGRLWSQPGIIKAARQSPSRFLTSRVSLPPYVAGQIPAQSASPNAMSSS